MKGAVSQHQDMGGRFAMYDQFYGFTGRPFQLIPDPQYYFESGSHRKAMSYLGYGLAQGEGMIVITGETGVGKTILIAHLLETIDPADINAVSMAIPADGADDFLILAAEQFGLKHEGEDQGDLLRGIEIHLRSQLRAGRRTLLIVDDAQHLSLSAMEQLLALSNLRKSGHPLAQIFLLGFPEFRQRLTESPTLDALQQRIIAAHHLDAMEAVEVEPYVFHRLSKAGWNGSPSISPDAFVRLYAHSGGLPSRLNSLFSRLLLHGALEELPRIMGEHVDHVVRELAEQSGAGQSSAAHSAAAGESPVMAAAAEHLTLQHRIAKLEARVAEQDDALRRMIDLLITWVDQQDEDSETMAAMGSTAMGNGGRKTDDFVDA